MNFNQIDLNVDNYNIQELFLIIGITEWNHIDYNRKDIVHSYTNTIMSTIRKSNELDEDTKLEIIEFFHEVKRIILEYMTKQNNTVPIENYRTNENTIQKQKNPILQPPEETKYNCNLDSLTNKLVVDKQYFLEHLVDKMLQKTDIMNLVPSILSQSGIHNPIHRKTVHKVLNIDTVFRERYKQTKSTDFTHYLQPPLKNITSMRLSSVEIPNVWHMFNKELHNNIIEITVYNFHEPNSDAIYNGANFDKPINEIKINEIPTLLKTRKYRIEIPEGNYTTDEFMFTMNKLLWNHNQDYDPTVETDDIDYDIKSKKYLDNDDFSGLRFLKFSLNPLKGETTVGTIPRMETSIPGNPISHRVNTWAKTTRLTDNILYNDYITPYQTIDLDVDTRNKSYTMESLHHSFAFTIDFDPDKYFEKDEIPVFNAGWFLGFRKNQYHVTMTDTLVTEHSNESSPNETLLVRKATLQSEGIFGSHFHYYIYLVVEDFQHNKYESVITNSEFVNNPNILARITINTNFNTIIFNNDNENIYKKRDYFGPVTLDKLHFKLIDKFGRLIDIRDNNYSLSLELEQLYN